MNSCRIGVLAIHAIVLALCVTPEASAEGKSPVYYRGNYYPGQYYSQSYLRSYAVPNGTRALHPVLVPYDRYGQHRLGRAFPPLADGDIHSDRYPYRYIADFQPVAKRRPVLPDPCDPTEGDKYRVTYPSPFVPPLPPPHPLQRLP